VNAIDEDSRTPISYAAKWDHIEVVKLLLHHPDIDVNATGGDSRPHQEIFRMLGSATLAM
jgi:ankyrin repeat protein